MIATSICQKALAVILMMLIISALHGCKEESIVDKDIPDLLPEVVGSYVGILHVGADRLSGVKVSLVQSSDSTLQVIPITDLILPFACEVYRDDNLLLRVNDNSAVFFSIDLLRSPFELEVYDSLSGTYFLGDKAV
ncbi:MAG TPA: hypothetical protein ENJ82_07385 [Bacteroidetes bacterium]|nr:hypothetical protein [Bacteroidota bacterium]